MASLLTKERLGQQDAGRSTRASWLWWFVRVALDALLINVAFLVAYLVRFVLQDVPEESWRPIDDFAFTRLLLTGFIVAVLQAKGLYHLRRGVPFLDEVAGVASSVTIGLALTIVAGVALRTPPPESRGVLVYTWVLLILALAAWRGVARLVRYQLWGRGIGIERVVVVGAGGAGRRLMQALADQRQLGYHLAGFVDDGSGGEEVTIATQHRVIRAAWLGSFHDLGEVVRRFGVHEVFIALPSASHEHIMHLLATCREQRVRFTLVPDLFEVSFDQVQINEVNGVPLIGLKQSTLSSWEAFLKRTLDIVVSVAGLIVAAPLFLLIAAAIKLDSPGPIFFRQMRVGKGGLPFVCYKFRTMVQDAEQRQADLLPHNEADGPLFKIRDDPRRTRVGRLLRRTSLDESAQIINVLRGEMSLVGPRPPVPSEVAQYEEWHRQRLLVTPGITGLWQVSGRSMLTFDEMVLLDLYYAEHWSLWLDLKILLRTIPAVVLARGAY